VCRKELSRKLLRKGKSVTTLALKGGYTILHPDPKALRVVVPMHKETASYYVLADQDARGLFSGISIVINDVFFFPATFVLDRKIEYRVAASPDLAKSWVVMQRPVNSTRSDAPRACRGYGGKWTDGLVVQRRRWRLWNLAAMNLSCGPLRNVRGSKVCNVARRGRAYVGTKRYIFKAYEMFLRAAHITRVPQESSG
jgi:hypothetical protein